MQKRPRIYLCGAIHGLTYPDATGWRQRAGQLLAPEFDVLDPTFHREYEGVDYSRYTDAEIKARDIAYIDRARAVLRYYQGTSSEGSAMETFYASHIRGIPVVTFGCSEPREDLSLWLRLHTVRNFFLLEDAVRFLKSSWLFPGEELEPAYSATECLTAR